MTFRLRADEVSDPRRHSVAARRCVLAANALLVSLSLGAPSANAESARSDALDTQKTTRSSVITPPKTSSEGSRGGTSSASANLTSGVLAVRFELEFPDGCGTLAQFSERLQARLIGIRLTEHGAERTVLARIESVADGRYRATMALLHPNGRAAERAVAANSCAEAIEALTLITAVALEPLAVAPEPSNAAAASSPPQLPNTKPVSDIAQSSNAHDFTGQPAGGAMTSSDATVFGFGAAYAAFRGQSPGLLNGVDLSARVMRRSWLKLSPSVRLGLAYAVKRGYAAEGGVADFAFASSTLDLCPGQALWDVAELRACALLLGGVVVANGRATLAPESHSRPFFALGATVEVVLLPHRSLGVPIRFSSALPTSRDRYAFDPAAFYRVPAVTLGLTVGLEARFR